MAHALPNGSDSRSSRFSEAVGRLLGSKATLPSAAAVLVVVLLLFGYELRSYLNADCYAAMHEARVDRQMSETFDDVGAAIVGLRKGTANVSRWGDREFQEQLQEALSILADGRGSLKEGDAFGALDAVVDLEKIIAQAKSRATDRVNFILRRQDPHDYDAFEKYRREGGNLVAVVKSLDESLEALAARTKRLPRACNW